MVALGALTLLASPMGAFAVQNAVGQLPVMGWSGYNAFMQHSGHCDRAGAGGYNETTFVKTMDVLKASGLADLGYKYLNVDDCWIAENRTDDGRLASDPVRFPHGMAWLVEQAHERGLRLGLYASASKKTCRNYPGSQGFEEVDAQTFAEWGADFAKLDSCGPVPVNGSESWADQYGRWSAAMNATGRQMVFSCSWGTYFARCAGRHTPSEWATHCGIVPWQNGFIGGICHMWRYGHDLEPNWGAGDGSENMYGWGGSGVGDIIQYASSFWASSHRGSSGIGAFLDPDFLVVGCPTDRRCESFSAGEVSLSSGGRPLTDLEQRTQMSMWCFLAAPLIIGSDIRSLGSVALETLSNEHAIAINQDALAAPPHLVWSKPLSKGGEQFWTRQLANGDIAVVLLNMHPSNQTNISIELAEVVCADCPRSAKFFDVWTGEARQAEGQFSASVAPHEARLFRVTPLAKVEHVVL